jgi:hypothetical protein
MAADGVDDGQRKGGLKSMTTGVKIPFSPHNVVTENIEISHHDMMR